MGRLILIQFVTLDGVVEDPDGSDRTPFGGWALRHGRQGVAGDRFRLGAILEHGTLLLGRRTWEHFSTLWPARTDEFSRAMNAAAKAVLTHRPLGAGAWSNSRPVDRPVTEWVRAQVAAGDVVVMGSGSVTDQLVPAGLVDEYRLLTFPTAVGAGRRLFPEGRRLELVSAEQAGPGVLSVLAPAPA